MPRTAYCGIPPIPYHPHHSRRAKQVRPAAACRQEAPLTTAESTGAIMEKGYNGKLLAIDLTSGTINIERPDDSLYRQYLGGYGIGARMLWDRVPKGADALG